MPALLTVCSALYTRSSSHNAAFSAPATHWLNNQATLRTQYVYNSDTSRAEKVSRKGSLAHYFAQLIKKVSYQQRAPATELPRLTKVHAEFRVL